MRAEKTRTGKLAAACLRAASNKSRRMQRSTIHGTHSHESRDGHRVNVWERGGKFVLRGYWQAERFGVTLDADEDTVFHELQRILIQMDDGTFVRPSEQKKIPRAEKKIPLLDLRGVISAFLMEKRRNKGRKTFKDYVSRLDHVLDFAERPENRRCWKLARDIDRQFAVELRRFLINCDVTRNGRANPVTKKMSMKMVQLCLESLRSALHWARRADVRKLPVDFVNPISNELIGPKPIKDPLRPNPIPMGQRIEEVRRMDAWQLCTLTIPSMLPVRFEDVSGALISDFDLASRTWRIGVRFGGSDFTKARLTVHMPLPPISVSLLKLNIGDRVDGPMFLARRRRDRRRRHSPSFASRANVDSKFAAVLKKAGSDRVQAEQDRKELFREMLASCGGVTTRSISLELRRLMESAGVRPDITAYNHRSSVTMDMNQAFVGKLAYRYLTYFTEHSLGNVMNDYIGLDVHTEMQKYFDRIQPLLDAIEQRARELGLPIEIDPGLNRSDNGIRFDAGWIA